MAAFGHFIESELRCALILFSCARMHYEQFFGLVLLVEAILMGLWLVVDYYDRRRRLRELDLLRATTNDIHLELARIRSEMFWMEHNRALAAHAHAQPEQQDD